MKRVAVLALLLSLLLVWPVAADCANGTSGDDTIVCDTNPPAGSENILAGSGHDSVTINPGVTVGNIQAGNGNDTVVNNGTANAINGQNDNDSLTNNGTAGNIGGGAGNDTINNNKNATANGLNGGSEADLVNNAGTANSINGNSGDDTIVNSGTVNNNVQGDEGNDFITNEETGTIGRRIDGGAGDDTLINHGTVQQDVFGNEGNDVLINESTGVIKEDMNGEGGNDTLTNNGFIERDFEGGAGDDKMTNNGIVGIDMEGKDGSDTLIVNGTVQGGVWGQGATGTDDFDGDDLIILQNGANGGDDSLLNINGGAGINTLVFDFETNDQSEYDQLISAYTAAETSTLATGSGTLSFRGQTFAWVSIQQLQNLIRLIIDQTGEKPEDVLAEIVINAGFRDGRINYLDLAAPAALYCTSDKGVAVWGINGNGEGYHLYSVSGTDLNNGSGGVFGDGNMVLSVFSDGNVLFNAPGYSFSFTTGTCGD